MRIWEYAGCRAGFVEGDLYECSESGKSGYKEWQGFGGLFFDIFVNR